MHQAFEIGDEVRGKDSLLKGRVLKVLDAGYLMILETEFEMEMNIHESEIIKAEVLDFRGTAPKKDLPPVQKKYSIRLDLHLEKLPSNYKSQGALFGQISYCEYKIATAIQSGVRSMEIIHGKGSGKLHQALLKVLKCNASIKSIEIKKAALELPHGIIISFY